MCARQYYVIEIAAKQGRIVGVERDHQSIFEILANRMVFRAAATASPQIAGHANFDGNLPRGQDLNQLSGSRAAVNA